MGSEETGIVAQVEGKQSRVKVGETIIRVDPRYYRPTEVASLLGDASKAREKLGWIPQCSFEELVKEMIQSDYALARRDAMVRLAGFDTFEHHE
jgi:GDPmannose 4,6-dehydratase